MRKRELHTRAPRRVGKCDGLNNVHSPGCEHPRNSREEARPIRGQQGQRKAVAFCLSLRLQGSAREFAIESEVRGNLRRRMNREIATREAFKEALDFRARRAA